MLDLAAPHQLWFTLETLVQNLHMALRKQASTLSGRNAGEFIEKLQAAAWKRVDNNNEVNNNNNNNNNNNTIFNKCSNSNSQNLYSTKTDKPQKWVHTPERWNNKNMVTEHSLYSTTSTFHKGSYTKKLHNNSKLRIFHTGLYILMQKAVIHMPQS